MTDTLATIDLEEQAELLRALAHQVRLELLRSIATGERSVGEIEADTGVGQPGLSQQLAVLRKADLVLTRREAKQIFYRINAERLAAVRTLIDALAGGSAEARKPPSIRPEYSTGGAATFARIRRD